MKKTVSVVAVSIDATPPVVGRRNHFTPVENYVDLALHDPRLNLSDNPEARAVLTALVTRTLQEARNALAVGAERGIGQAMNLLLDPEFYGASKVIRSRQRGKYLDQRRAEESVRLQREMDPTPEDILQKKAWLVQMVEYHTKALIEARGKLQEFESSPITAMSRISNSATRQ